MVGASSWITTEAFSQWVGEGQSLVRQSDKVRAKYQGHQEQKRHESTPAVGTVLGHSGIHITRSQKPSSGLTVKSCEVHRAEQAS